MADCAKRAVERKLGQEILRIPPGVYLSHVFSQKKMMKIWDFLVGFLYFPMNFHKSCIFPGFLLVGFSLKKTIQLYGGTPMTVETTRAIGIPWGDHNGNIVDFTGSSTDRQDLPMDWDLKRSGMARLIEHLEFHEFFSKDRGDLISQIIKSLVH